MLPSIGDNISVNMKYLKKIKELGVSSILEESIGRKWRVEKIEEATLFNCKCLLISLVEPIYKKYSLHIYTTREGTSIHLPDINIFEEQILN